MIIIGKYCGHGLNGTLSNTSGGTLRGSEVAESTGATMGGILDSISEWLEWLSHQWWFWILLVVIAIAIVLGLSMLLWGVVIALTRWAFSTWRRALVAVPVLLALIVLFIVNFGAIFQWVNDYWPITMIPTLIVVAVPLIMIFGLSSGGGSSSHSGSAMVCGICGSVAGGCPHTSSSYSDSSSGQSYDMFSDPKNHSDLS